MSEKNFGLSEEKNWAVSSKVQFKNPVEAHTVFHVNNFLIEEGLEVLAENLPTLWKNFWVRLSDLQSSCPEECYEEKLQRFLKIDCKKGLSGFFGFDERNFGDQKGDQNFFQPVQMSFLREIKFSK